MKYKNLSSFAQGGLSVSTVSQIRWAALAGGIGLSLLAGCAASGGGKPGAVNAPPPVIAPASAPVSVAAPEPAPSVPTAAESALSQGVKSYQAGKYQMAETQLRLALKEGLTVPADIANAHKHLAFIYCTSKRDNQCLASFKAAKVADPAFELSKAESGHPMWARTYKKAMAAAAAASTKAAPAKK
ncbi:TssQ family T6SS-associated lipoprotein [Aquabacterium sp.]|uniref:TssQ family T6SS-associated lipoprotein n=1 Tax=Aquabacterium sp. TaxID=1872578 RepID=UPI0025BC899F|nr:TssQ family T6SS-associated lipoprotein [Aquabacterium sp.]